MIRIWAILCLLGGTAALAQSDVIETTPLPDQVAPPIPPAAPTLTAEQGSGAVLRALDKVSGATVDATVQRGGRVPMFGLQVDVADCRFPVGDPAGDAYAYLIIREPARDGALAFQGWMIASSPALSALDHARYDVWLLRCITS